MKAHWQKTASAKGAESPVKWLENRTGLPSLVRHFLYEEIPASSGWHQVFGSVAVFLFLVQVFTGILLAINYAPTPGDAYNSLRFILTELTAGRLIRGLHHWGASMMICVVVLHMVQVFLYGAYKKPREATWMVGVVLLLVTLAYGLTGYLLPWDNRAYWGTVVVTQIAATAPLIGPYLVRLLGSTDGIGVVTFARFYGVHVLLLPPATFLLIFVHVLLVRKHGVAPQPGDEYRRRKRFFPEQVFKDTVAIFVTFAVLFTLAVAVRVPLDRLADPSDISYIPRPEWYFLFLFQTLKLFKGPLEILGTIILPGLAVLALVSMPFIDRSRLMHVSRRTGAILFVLLAVIGWSGLTAAAVLTTPAEARTSLVDYSRPTEWIEAVPNDLAAVASFRANRCAGCHEKMPQPTHKSLTWLRDHFAHNHPVTAPLNNFEAQTLAAFLVKPGVQTESLLRNTPDFAAQGARLFAVNHCAVCHTVNGTGAPIGPPLNGLAARRTRDWIQHHFAAPQKLSPGTIMPRYALPEQEMNTLTSYLLSLHD
jgi:ubiquinol-cytochrome c reductase cytochrome b subunit